MTKMLDVIHLAVAKSELSLCRALSKANHGGVNKERVWADSKTQGPDRDTHTYTQPTHAADTHTHRRDESISRRRGDCLLYILRFWARRLVHVRVYVMEEGSFISSVPHLSLCR